MTVQTFDFFKFYEDYLWTHADFENLQDAIKTYQEAGFRSALQSKVLSGLGFENPVVLDFDVAPGGAIDNSGRALVVSSAETLSATSDGSNPVWHLVVIRRKVDLINDIPEPLNPTNPVPLNERQSAEVVLIPGTPAGSPAYPSKVLGDVILFGLKMPTAAASVLSSYVDYSVSEYVRPNEELLKSIIGYDAVVTSDRGGTHQNLEALVADAALGTTIRKVVVLKSQTVDTLTINADDVEIEFRKGVTLSKNSSATGMIVEGEGVTLKGLRMLNFNGGSDNAVVWRGEYGNILTARFKLCDNEVIDESVNGLSVLGTHTEV